MASSHRIPGLAAAVSAQLRSLRAHAGAHPETPSGPMAPASILSDLNRTPFKPDLDLSEFLHAI